MDIILPSVASLYSGRCRCQCRCRPRWRLLSGLDLDQLLLEREAAARYARVVSEEDTGEEERVGVPWVLDGGEERDPV